MYANVPGVPGPGLAPGAGMPPQNLFSLIQLLSGSHPQGSHYPPPVAPNPQVGHAAANAINIAPFQAAVMKALQQSQTQQQGLGLHPQVDRIHAIQAGAHLARQALVPHTLMRHQGRGV